MGIELSIVLPVFAAAECLPFGAADPHCVLNGLSRGTLIARRAVATEKAS